MVSIFNLWGRAAFAACLFFAALSCPGCADDYGNARAAFNRLSIDQRYETQALLGVAGYWPAVANDEFNHRLISAPVQPGNSGGPLLDYSGNVVGVVEGKLNAITVATVTNDMAQNVNFAIKANVVTNFLDANSVAYTSGSLASTALPASEIAEHAKSLAVMIECNK
jgi:hypothetical protein